MKKLLVVGILFFLSTAKGQTQQVGNSRHQFDLSESTISNIEVFGVKRGALPNRFITLAVDYGQQKGGKNRILENGKLKVFRGGIMEALNYMDAYGWRVIVLRREKWDGVVFTSYLLGKRK